MAVISEASLDRIVAAVGAKLIAINFDKNALQGCLELALRRYSDAVRYKSKRQDNLEIRHFEKIRKTAKRLELLIGPVDIRQWGKMLPGPPPPEYVPPFDSPVARFTTTELVAAIDLKLKSLSERDELYAKTFRKYNPFDWMIGVYLADVYKLNFRRPPTIALNGPFVRFAEAVLSECKITKSNGRYYKRASILKSLRTVRAGQVRRKVGSGEQKYHHWSFSQLAEAYRNSASPDDQEAVDPDGPKITIVDQDAVAKYLISIRDPEFLVLLMKLVDEDVKAGITPPGVKLIEVFEPEDPLSDIDMGNSE